jgi:hypothetical protein
MQFPKPISTDFDFAPGIQIIDSGMVGAHDLYWADSKDATKGYNIYRAYDHPTNWVKLNPNIWSKHFYRDVTTLQQVQYVVNPDEFIEKGEVGQWVIRLRDVPYATANIGANRVNVANSPDDVTVICDGVSFRPTSVNAFDRTVTMLIDNRLAQGGAVSDTALVHTTDVSVADYNGVQEWQVVYNKLTNFVDIYAQFNRTYYTVVPVGDKGECHKPGAKGTSVVNTQEVDKIDWVFEEMVRRNQYLFETTGEPALCFFRKWRGEVCGCVFGSQQPKTACPVCFETGFVDGYHGPFDFLFVPPDSALARVLDEGGIKTTRSSRSYMTRTPIVQNGDLILRGNGDIMVISDVVYKMPRGIILQQDFTVELLSPGDTRYLAATAMIRKNFNSLPTLYNPIVRPDPKNGVGTGQPVFDPRTVPSINGGKDWENPNIPIGKTVEFGKIQT